MSYDFYRLCFFPTVSRTSDSVEKKHSLDKKSYDFFNVIWLFRQCRKFSTLSEKSIRRKKSYDFFPTMLFSTLARRAKSPQCSNLARLSSVEKSIVEKTKSHMTLGRKVRHFLAKKKSVDFSCSGLFQRGTYIFSELSNVRKMTIFPS